MTPRFSRQLQPIFEAAAKALENEEKLVFGKVDCDNDGIGLDVDDHDSALRLAHVAGEEVELA